MWSIRTAAYFFKSWLIKSSWHWLLSLRFRLTDKNKSRNLHFFLKYPLFGKNKANFVNLSPLVTHLTHSSVYWHAQKPWAIFFSSISYCFDDVETIFWEKIEWILMRDFSHEQRWQESLRRFGFWQKYRYELLHDWKLFNVFKIIN